MILATVKLYKIAREVREILAVCRTLNSWEKGNNRYTHDTENQPHNLCKRLHNQCKILHRVCKRLHRLWGYSVCV